MEDIIMARSGKRTYIIIKGQTHRYNQRGRKFRQWEKKSKKKKDLFKWDINYDPW